MKKCSDCDVEMIEEYGIRVDEPISVRNEERMYIVSKKEDFFGERIGENDEEVNCRVCPNCGKIELYINTELIKEEKMKKESKETKESKENKKEFSKAKSNIYYFLMIIIFLLGLYVFLTKIR